MRISIVVPALNEEECLAGTLRNLLSLAGEKEIVVVDGGSTDATVPIALAEGFRVIHSARGRGNQMHAGAIETTGEVLWFVHADTEPPAHALDEIRKSLADPSTAGGNFGLVFDGPSRAAGN